MEPASVRTYEKISRSIVSSFSTKKTRTPLGEASIFLVCLRMFYRSRALSGFSFMLAYLLMM